MADTADCPYCKAEDIDVRGLKSHVRFCSDDLHGPKYEVPDDLEEQVEEHCESSAVKEIDFSQADPDFDHDTSSDGTPSYCTECGSRDLHELDDGEPIAVEGTVIGNGDDGDIICLECGEIVRGEVEYE